ncbi:MAG: hypothetical protein ACRBHB_09020 [Arenicella sp.]
MKERLIKISGNDPIKAMQELKELGVQVLHRSGDTLVIAADEQTSLTADVARIGRAVSSQPLVITPNAIDDADLTLLAFQLRQTDEFKRGKKQRETDGEDWGEIFAGL